MFAPATLRAPLTRYAHAPASASASATACRGRSACFAHIPLQLNHIQLSSINESVIISNHEITNSNWSSTSGINIIKELSFIRLNR